VLLATVLVAVGLVLALRPYDPSHRAESLREWRWTLFEPMVLLVLLTVLRTRSAQFPLMRGFLAAALIGGATVAGVQAFFDFATGGGVQVAGVTRIAGPYPHPNALALYATRVVALAIAWMVFVPQVRRWLVLPTLIVTLTTLATFSRGALAAMVSGLSLLIPAIERRLRAAVIGSAGVVLSGLVLVERDRMLDLFGGGSGSLRLDIWRSTLRMIGDRPLTGYGPDQFLYAYLPRYIAPTAWSERFTSHAHNLILDFWVRLGIIGGAFAIAVVVIGTLRAYHVMRGRTRFDSLTAAGSVALVAAIVHGTVDNAYFAHDLAISGWFVAWLAFTPVSDDREERTPRARPRSWRSRFYRIPSL
jgi:O-antigen ligase